MPVKLLLPALVLVVVPLVSAQDIGGLWKHAEEPGWIEISLEKGAGTVVRNDKFPERVGRQILKDISADKSKPALWHAQVFAQALGEYKDAKVSLPEPDEMHIKVKVGFLSRTIEWRRVPALPDGGEE